MTSNLTISLELGIFVLGFMRDDINHVNHRNNTISLNDHFFICIHQQFIRFFNALSQLPNFISSDIIILQIKQLGLVFLNVHLEISLLLFKFFNSRFIFDTVFLVLHSKFGNLFHHGRDLGLKMIAPFLCKVNPLFFFVAQKSFSLTDALIQNLKESFEYVIKHERLDKRSVVVVSFHKSLLPVLDVAIEFLLFIMVIWRVCLFMVSGVVLFEVYKLPILFVLAEKEQKVFVKSNKLLHNLAIMFFF
jgi:hypothetical protein